MILDNEVLIADILNFRILIEYVDEAQYSRVSDHKVVIGPVSGQFRWTPDVLLWILSDGKIDFQQSTGICDQPQELVRVVKVA